MANIYISSVAYTAVAQWTALTPYVSTANGGRGDYVRQLAAPAVGSERVFRCTVSGTSLAAEPAWNLTKNATTAEAAGPTWTECTGQEADQVSGTWKAPHARLASGFAATWGAAGDVFFLSSDHAETRTTATTITCPGNNSSPCLIISVTKTTVPPVSANIASGASLTTTGASGMALRGTAYYHGVAFNVGTGATGGSFSIGDNGGRFVFENCALNIVSTASWDLVMGGNGTTMETNFKNTTVSFGNNGSRIAVNYSRLTWEGTASALTAPAALSGVFTAGAGGGVIICDGVDFSLLGSGDTIVTGTTLMYEVHLRDCKLGASVAIASTPSASGGPNVYVSRTDSGATNYRSEKYLYEGIQVTETTVIRTGGASDGTTGVSWKITGGSALKFLLPFKGIPMAVPNDTTGANVTLTVEGVQDPRTSVTLPNNDDIWFNVLYLGSGSTPIATIALGTKADPLAAGAALTASTEAWDSLVTARANTTAYSLGDIRKVASNPGRIFVCTTAGTSAGSEPAGYASAVDGGSVTDNTAVFKAAVRFKQSITLSAPQPALKGRIYLQPYCAKASGIFYLDPKVTVS